MLKTKYPFILLVLVLVISFTGITYAKTVKRHYPDGTLEAVVSYDKKGKRNGPYKTYWPNGKIKEQGRNKNGQQTGPVKQWDMDGNLVE